MIDEKNQDTEVPIKQRRPSVGKNGVPTPPGFEKYPERIHSGAWRKENTARYKLEKMLMMSEVELKDLAEDPKTPLFERRLATFIKNDQWKSLEGMMNQVYGLPKQVIERPEEEVNQTLVLQRVQSIFSIENENDKKRKK